MNKKQRTIATDKFFKSLPVTEVPRYGPPFEPPWLAFPDYDRYSMGFRMGSGEDYIHQLSEWYNSASTEDIEAFKQDYPEAKTYLGFYATKDKWRNERRAKMTDEIQSRVTGNLGHITLNRPKALNALTLDMCKEITRLLLGWEADDKIGAVLIDGAGNRAFCAGGDVIMLHDSGKAGDSRAEQFWRVEYALNELIHRYTKPYIALIDGVVMGGGVGLSVHGDIRIAGDTTLFAMPETGIGYFPDVGGTYFLPRLNYHDTGLAMGQWLGLTGARLNTAQTCDIGVANAYVPSDQHAALIDALGGAKLDGSHGAVSAVIADFVKAPPQSDLDADYVKLFNQGSVGAILKALDVVVKQDGSDEGRGAWAAKQASLIRRKSPFAMAASFEAIKRGAELDFKGVMSMELDLSMGFLTAQDFFEGIRSQLIDKDRNPKWSHADVDDVSISEVERVFRKTPKALEFLS